MTFPKNFHWGTATAAYQIEGAARTDGKGLSVWDTFTRREGAIWQGHTGDVACDHYHRWREDVALMGALGLTAYRFSIAWARVIPAGTGKVNPKGLAFYDRLVDALLQAGITPFVTLFHWDYPYDLYCRGGWLNAESPRWFADYATVIARKLGDRVKHWMTLNEPSVFIGLGHDSGSHAPGDKLRFAEVLRATHHVLLAHGFGVRALRAGVRGRCQIGFAPAPLAACPATNRAADVAAAKRRMFSVTARDVWNNTWWMDPVFRGRYPADGLKLFEADLPPIGDGDLKTISAPVDFFGVNIYQAETIRAGRNGRPETVPPADGAPLTLFHWNVTPEALYWVPRFFHERYRKPIYITENGMSNIDWVTRDGRVHDPQRIDFTTRYLQALGRAIADGVDGRGYFHWSFLDNFEWAEGYKQRFGLVHVDYTTRKRTPKDSARWYAEVVRTNGGSL